MKQRMLLIGINFYNYEEQIKYEFEQLGYDVDLVYDAPDNFTFLARVCSEEALRKKVLSYQMSLFDSTIKKDYSLVLVVVGRALSAEFLKKLKEFNPDARYVLYLWDDVKRVSNFEAVKEYYDEIYSFDPVDCHQNGFGFLPLFYTREYGIAACEKKYDIYSAVSNHSDRIRIVNEICTQLPDKELLFYINMGKVGYMKHKLNFLKKGRDKRINYVKSPIPKVDNNKYLCESKAILDAPFKGQIGLTIRTLETMASGVKLITTNQSIQYYDFYRPENIYILDRENPKLDESFLDVDYKPLPSDIYEKYSLREWVKSIATKDMKQYLKEEYSLADVKPC